MQHAVKRDFVLLCSEHALHVDDILGNYVSYAIINSRYLYFIWRLQNGYLLFFFYSNVCFCSSCRFLGGEKHHSLFSEDGDHKAEYLSWHGDNVCFPSTLQWYNCGYNGMSRISDNRKRTE